jgi:hypothetical protein
MSKTRRDKMAGAIGKELRGDLYTCSGFADLSGDFAEIEAATKRVRAYNATEFKRSLGERAVFDEPQTQLTAQEELDKHDRQVRMARMENLLLAPSAALIEKQPVMGA